MHTSLSKKLLAGLLSLVMVLSLVAPGTSAQAATKYSLTDKKSVKSGYTFKYKLKGVSKGCYVIVTRNVSGEKVVYNKKEGAPALTADTSWASLKAGLSVKAGTKVYISVADETNNNEGTFDHENAQCIFSVTSALDTKYATNLSVEWCGDANSDIIADGNYYYSYIHSTVQVNEGDPQSGVTVDDLYVSGYVNGKAVDIPAEQFTIKSDSYEPIFGTECLTAVKTATIVVSVQLLNANDEPYTEEISCEYQYSAAEPKFEQILTNGQLFATGYTSVTGSAITANKLDKDFLGSLFKVYDQYGEDQTANYTQSFEISLGRNSSDLTVVNNNSINAYIDCSDVNTTTVAEIIVTCTLINGKTATEYLYLNKDGFTPAP